MVDWIPVQPFLSAAEESSEGAWALVGAPFDATSSYRAGSREGTVALRLASQAVEEYCPISDRSLDETGFVDLGDITLPIGDTALALGCIREAIDTAWARGLKPLLLGGEHTVSLPAIEAAAAHHPDLCLLHLDAHADLREDYLGVELSHACVIRRALESLAPERLFQFGIRSGTRDEWRFMRAHDTLRPATREAAAALVEQLRGRPVYLTLDLDVLDPSVLPGTGTPEPGGLSFRELDDLLRELTHADIVAADVVELSPGLDGSGVSSVTAAKILRTLLLNLSH